MATQYFNFTMEAFDYKNDGTETFSVRVADSPLMDMGLADAEKVTIDPEIRQQLRRLELHALDLQGLILLGEQLSKLLFPPNARTLLENNRYRLQEGQALRIRLKLNAYELADIPWEYCYLSRPGATANQKGTEGFIALDRQFSLVRNELRVEAPPPFAPVGTRALRLVAFFDDPATAEYPALRLDVEKQKIEEALSTVSSLRFEPYPAATVQTLQDVLINGAEMFHFSGHGKFEGVMGAMRGSVEGKGYVVLLDDKGGPLAFPAEKLAANLANCGVRLAVLGACEAGRRDGVNAWSGVAAALISRGIPAVVGMQYTIQDNNAILFSRAFYRVVAAGEPIETAVTLGRLAIFNNTADDERDWGVPVLYTRGDASILFPRPNPPKGWPDIDPGGITTGDEGHAQVDPTTSAEVRQNPSPDTPTSPEAVQLPIVVSPDRAPAPVSQGSADLTIDTYNPQTEVKHEESTSGWGGLFKGVVKVAGMYSEMSNKAQHFVQLRLGDTAFLENKYELAHNLYQLSLKFCTQIGDQEGIAFSLMGLGRVAGAVGNLEDAHSSYMQSLTILRSLGNQEKTAEVLTALGALSEQQGNKEEARELYQQALTLYEQLGSPNVEAARQAITKLDENPGLRPQ